MQERNRCIQSWEKEFKAVSCTLFYSLTLLWRVAGDMGASKQLLSDLKTKIFQLCEISAVGFHGEERCEGHSHRSCSGQMWQATKNTGEVKDVENGQIKPTQHLQKTDKVITLWTNLTEVPWHIFWWGNVLSETYVISLYFWNRLKTNSLLCVVPLKSSWKCYVYCLGTAFHFDFCHLLKPVAPTVGRPTAAALRYRF